MSHQDLLDRIMAWAGADPNVLALVITGSRAAVHGRPDEWSDLDIEVICDDPAPLVGDDAWFHRFGEVLVYLRLMSEEGDRPTRLVVYAEGEVDFSVCGRERITSQYGGLVDLYRRGYRVVFDREGITGALPAPDGEHTQHPPPTAGEYREAVSVFWFEAYHLPGYIDREDLWALKFRDATMKEHLRRMLEWAAVAGDPGADVRQIGHRMAEWADPQTWADLHEAFGRFDAASSWRALLVTVEVFRRAARRVAAAYGFDYPEEADRRITERIVAAAPGGR